MGGAKGACVDIKKAKPWAWDKVRLVEPSGFHLVENMAPDIKDAGQRCCWSERLLRIRNVNLEV